MSFSGFSNNVGQFSESTTNSPYLRSSQNVSLTSIPTNDNESRLSFFTPEPENIAVTSSIASLNGDKVKSSTSTKRQIPVTNKHTQPQDNINKKKKRRANYHACDGCAFRKVGCDEGKPCKPCIRAKIECTFNRDIGKSGPKTCRATTFQKITNYQAISEIRNVIDPSDPSNTSVASGIKSSSPVKDPAIELEASGSSISHLSTSNPTPIPSTVSSNLGNNNLTSNTILSTNSNNNTNHKRDIGPNYRPTPSNLIENIKLIGEEPIIRDLLQPLTVQSLILNHSKLTDFLNANFANYFNSPINPMDQEINLSNHHDDPLFLSQILIILTINLLITEILIKFKKRKFKTFVKYPKKNMDRDFKTFKNLCHYKCIEIFSYIEINLIVPTVIPPKAVRPSASGIVGNSGNNINNVLHSNSNSTNNNNPTNTTNSASTAATTTSTTTINNNNTTNNINSSGHNLNNLHQVFYNLSLSCLHLCNYYHTLNLTNTLNAVPTVPTSTINEESTDNISNNILRDGNYGNEIQEYQKVLNLNRSITYFQLINIKNKHDNSLNIKLSELFEMIFTFERYYLIFSSFNYNMHRFRNNDIIIQLNCNKIMKYKRESINNNYKSNRLFQLLNFLEDGEENDEKHFSNLCKNTSFNVKLNYIEDGILSDYWRLKRKIYELIPVSDKTDDNEKVFEIIRNGILFKLLLIYPIGFEELRTELYELIANLNQQLQPSDSEVFKLKISNYQLIPHLLHLLKTILHIEAIKSSNPGNIEIDELKLEFFSPDSANQLLTFSDYLAKHFTFFNNINKLIRTDALLNNWYRNLKENINRLKNQPINLRSNLHQGSGIISNNITEIALPFDLDTSALMDGTSHGYTVPPGLGHARLSTTNSGTNGTSTPEDEDSQMMNSYFIPSQQGSSQVGQLQQNHYSQPQNYHQPPARPNMIGMLSSSSITASTTSSSMISSSNSVYNPQIPIEEPLPPVLTPFTATIDYNGNFGIPTSSTGTEPTSDQTGSVRTPSNPLKLSASATSLSQWLGSSTSFSNLANIFSGSGGGGNINNSNNTVKPEENRDSNQFLF
ncbi:uncharacterized protein RJT21DRAFT_121352 [Scheffersomyces amazonensis]|uniref:uncharacterized protein n=1 Tax=Scheffersomyces amazonensis TaxID=1078765 RepID=UPI00315D41FA